MYSNISSVVSFIFFFFFHSKTSCCYPRDGNDCMWKAGDKIIGNIGNVYEISVGPNDVGNYIEMTFDYALDSWVGSGKHNAVLQGTVI